MRHQRVMKKFGRSTAHRKAMMKNMVTNLILAESIQTTLPKAKQVRKDAEKMVTIARKGTLAARRLAASRLFQPKAVKKLFDKIVPAMEGRNGGYTRILKLGTRKGDGAQMAIIQWVTAPEAKDAAPKAEEAAAEEAASPAAAEVK
ncbi:MAG: 50S ribosomal protein L17 [Kiritimatiellae bacterium]|nr:50S ribosomal protein L17 [Kiritimatiellia bacterium]